jgi:hypothetical protein
MTKPKPIKPGRGGAPEILEGDSILEKLVNQMPPEKRQFVLLLMAELGLPKDDPSLPLLIALQYYVNILQDIPEAMEAAADVALKQALSAYAGIQTRLAGTVLEIDAVRANWLRDTQELLGDVAISFEGARQAAVQQYADLLRVNERRLKAFAKEWRDLQKHYAQDIRRQGMQIAFGVGLAALIVCSALAGWVGASSHPTLPTPTQTEMTFSRMATLHDNSLRLERCFKDQENNGGKCTFWIAP